MYTGKFAPSSDNVESALATVHALHMPVLDEKEICGTLIEWIEAQATAGNNPRPEELLPLIRWSGVSIDYICNKLLTNRSLILSTTCMSFLSSVMRYLMLGIQFKGLNTFHRTSVGLDNSMVVFLQSDTATTTLDVY